jgi:hypothetical protein
MIFFNSVSLHVCRAFLSVCWITRSQSVVDPRLCITRVPRRFTATRHRRTRPSAASVLGLGWIRERIEHLVEREAANFMAGWELFERTQEGTSVFLRWYEQQDTVDSPVGVIHGDMVGLLERIGAQVEQFAKAQDLKRLLPAVKAMSALLRKHLLRIII